MGQGGAVVLGNIELIVWLIRFIWHLFCGFDKCMIDFCWATIVNTHIFY